jgi:hypothetical protein
MAGILSKRPERAYRQVIDPANVRCFDELQGSRDLNLAVILVRFSSWDILRKHAKQISCRALLLKVIGVP